MDNEDEVNHFDSCFLFQVLNGHEWSNKQNSSDVKDIPKAEVLANIPLISFELYDLNDAEVKDPPSHHPLFCVNVDGKKVQAVH
jgi:hypothetical protein